MHDTNLEERLRSVLRQEGDGLPFTVTTDELERRLALRRRARTGQRLSLMAAGLAVLAVGAVLALGNGWLRTSNVATDPSPSPAPSGAASTHAPSVAPSASLVPTASPAPTPTPRVADPIGAPGEAIFVTPIGNQHSPDRYEVTAYDTVTSTSRTIATIPGSVLPENGDFDSDQPKISTTGWLAIPFAATPEGGGEFRAAIAIFDTRSPDGEPWILDGYGGMSWDPTDKLIVTKDQQVFVASPTSRTLEPFDVQSLAGVSGNGIETSGPAVAFQEGARFLASSLDERQAWGYLDYDGMFTPTDDLPPVYARFGLERPAGAGAHGLGSACDSGPDPASSGCLLVETDERHEPVETWVKFEETRMHSFAWASDGASAWLLLEAAPGSKQMSLMYATSSDDRAERARIKGLRAGVGDTAHLLGITGEQTAGRATAVVIGNADRSVHAIVREDGSVTDFDGTAWFAGWAADPAPYDPD